MNQSHCWPSAPQPYSRSSRVSGWGCDSKGASGIFSCRPLTRSVCPAALARTPQLPSRGPETEAKAWGLAGLSERGSSTGTAWPLPHSIIYPILFPYQRFLVLQSVVLTAFLWTVFKPRWLENMSCDPPCTFCVCVCEGIPANMKMSATGDPC